MKVGMPLWIESGYSHIQHINPLRTSLDQIKSIRLVGWSVVKIKISQQNGRCFFKKFILKKLMGKFHFLCKHN